MTNVLKLNYVIILTVLYKSPTPDKNMITFVEESETKHRARNLFSPSKSLELVIVSCFLARVKTTELQIIKP